MHTPFRISKGASRIPFCYGIFEFFNNHCALFHERQQLRLLELLTQATDKLNPAHSTLKNRRNAKHSVGFVKSSAIIGHGSPNLSKCSCPEKLVGTSLRHESSSSLWCAAFFRNYRRDGKNYTLNHSCNLLQSKRNSMVCTGVLGAHVNL